MENHDNGRDDQYKALFTYSRDAVMTLEPPSWSFTTGNPAAVKMFGAKNEADFLRYPPWELSPKLQPDGSLSMGKAAEMIDEAMQTGSNFFEWTHKRITGEEFPAEVLLSKIEHKGKAFLYATVRDISARKKFLEQEKASAEEKFEIIFNNTNDGMLLADIDSKKFFLGNRAICGMLGYSAGELKNLSVADIHPKESLQNVLDQFAKQARGDIKIAKNIPVKRKDGSIFYADVNTSSVKINNVNYNLGAFRDVTDRRIVEIEREQYLNFFRLSSDIMAIADPLGNFKKVNPACASILGYSEEELLGKPFLEFIHPDDKQRTTDEMHRQMQIGASLDFENRYMCKDGSQLWLSWKATYQKDEGLTYATARDITAQKKSAEEINKLANLYEILMKCDQAIAHSKNEHELTQTICEDVVNFDSIRMAWVGFVDKNTMRVVPVSFAGTDSGYLESIEVSASGDSPLGHGPTGTAIREGRPYWCQDFQHDPATIPWREQGRIPGWRSSASLPIYRGGETVGAITLYSGEINSFTIDAQHLLTEMSLDISHALDSFDYETERENSRKALQAKFDEIEKLNKFMVGREVKMAELKMEIETLKDTLKKSK